MAAPIGRLGATQAEVVPAWNSNLLRRSGSRLRRLRCETRRDAVLREMDRRRAFKVRMRAALPSLDDAADAQFDDLDGAD